MNRSNMDSFSEVMTPSTTVFELAKALSQPEKRYFRLYASRHKLHDENYYLILFDALNRQKEYDETALKERLERHGCKAKSFASLKHFLQSMICQAMREFHRERHPHRVVRDMIEDAEFLHSRGLIDASLKALGKAKEKAVRYEAFDAQLQIAELECEYNLTTDHALSTENWKRFENEAVAALETLTTLHNLKKLSFQLIYRARRDYILRDEAEINSYQEIMQLPVMQQAGHHPFFRRYYLYRSHALLAQLLGNFEANLQMRSQILTLWQMFPHMRDVLPMAFGNAIANYLNCCKDTDRYDAMPSAIAELRALEPRNPIESVFVRQNAAYNELLYVLNVGNLEEGRHLVKELESILKDDKRFINKARLLAIRYNLAIFHFFLEEFKASLAMINFILNDENSRHREDVQRATRLLQAVVHFELGNLDLLEYLLRSTTRFLQRSEKMYAFEATLIRALNRLAATASKTERNQFLQDLQKKLHHLRGDAQNRDAPGLQELQHWLAARLSGKRLRDVIAVSS